MRMRPTTLSSVAYLVVLYIFLFSKLSHKRHNFRESVIEHKMCVFILSTTFVWNIYHSRKKWSRYDQKFTLVHVKLPLFLPDFYENLISSTDFRKILKYRMLEKAGTVGAELFRADGRTDRHDEANSCFSQFCERSWKRTFSLKPNTRFCLHCRV